MAVLYQGARAHDRVRIHGRARTEEFAAGDVGYVPQGYGHYIENVGSEDLEVVIVLNNGTYQSISLTAWMAANPALLLSTNFGVPESAFANFPPATGIVFFKNSSRVTRWISG